MTNVKNIALQDELEKSRHELEDLDSAISHLRAVCIAIAVQCGYVY